MLNTNLQLIAVVLIINKIVVLLHVITLYFNSARFVPSNPALSLNLEIVRLMLNSFLFYVYKMFLFQNQCFYNYACNRQTYG